MTAQQTDSPVTVLVVDDHPLVRSGLVTMLQGTADLQVVGEAANGVEAVELCGRVVPDVVLMDLSMPVLDGVEATRQICRLHPLVAVVVLTSFADTARVNDALAAGAVGYLLKDCEPAVLLSGVRAAALGGSPLDPRVARALLPGVRRASPADSLSDREREVLVLVSQGLANKQIGRSLGIAERTVKVHLGNAFKRIGVQDRTSAALWVRDHMSP